MASVVEFLGLTRTVVTSVTQSVVVLKNQLKSYRSLTNVLDELLEKLKRINAFCLWLSEISKFAQIDSEEFVRALSNVQDVERELTNVHEAMYKNSNPRLFFSSCRLLAKLRDVSEKLSCIDRLLGLTVMVADLVSRKVQQSDGLRSRHNRVSHLISRIVAKIDEQNPSSQKIYYTLHSYEAVQLTYLGPPEYHQVSFASENRAQLYYLLGRSYYNGDHEQGINYFQAARFFNASFKVGYNSAAFYLGKLHFNGQGVEQCFRTAFNFFRTGTEHGDADSMHELAWCYEFGRGTAIDAKSAVRYYNMAAERGSGAGMWAAGYHALHGNNSRRNWSKAFRLIQGARKVGEKRANMELAQCYEYGISVERDPKMTFELLEEAQESGDIMSVAYFARCYEFGIGTEQDLKKAAELYKSIMSQSCWLAKLFQCFYGFFLVRGFGVQKNVRVGLKLLKSSLKTGHGDGWALYGDCFRFGYGVQKDAMKAVRCYSKAVTSQSGQRGIRDAHFALAEMYEVGEDIACNLNKAAHHYIKAANRMNSIAQWKAGSFFESGNQVKKHVQHAFYYFDLSARSGHPPAIRKAGELYMKGIGIQRDRTIAIQLLEEAVKLGDPDAKRILRRARRSNLFF